MFRTWTLHLCVFLLCLAPASPVQAAAPLPEAYVALSTRPGVSLPMAVLTPEQPRAVVILLSGGNGRLNIVDEAGQAAVRIGGNFLVRSRQLFAAQGLAVLVLDAPSDHAWGMDPRFRFSPEHVEDVRLAAAYARERWGLKPWLVGTSMGSISAAWAASCLLPGELGGVVLTSSVTRSGKRADYPMNRLRAVLDADLGKTALPALVVRHGADACAVSAPQDGPKILDALAASPRKALLTFEGGLPAQSGECEARSAHGYLGIEEQVVAGIAAFILDVK